jgi:ABC-type multidrug transport system fused ATPase/permease subunit
VIGEATSIVIAHRLSTVVNAHKIVLMNQGRIEAVGSHADLLVSNPVYGRLYRHQFAAAESLGES